MNNKDEWGGEGRGGEAEMSGEWEGSNATKFVHDRSLAPFFSSRSKDFPVLSYNKNVPSKA